MLADQIADAPAKREAADTDRCGIAEPDDQVVRLDRSRHLAGGQSSTDPGRPFVRVNLQPVEQAQIDDDSLWRCDVPAVATAANGNLQAVRACKPDGCCDVCGVRDPDDRLGPGIVVAGHDGAQGVVVGIRGSDRIACQSRSQHLDPVPRTWLVGL